MPLRIKHAAWALLPCLGLAVPALSQAAATPRYTYAELGYLNVDLDDVNADGDGFRVAGSWALQPNLHLLASYEDIDLDGDADASALSIGAGVNFPLRAGLDAVGRVRYISADLDQPGDDEDDGFGLEGGVRAMINPQLELNGGVRYVDVFDDNTSLFLGGLYEVVNNVAVGAELDFSDDVTTFFLSGRLYFNTPRAMR